MKKIFDSLRSWISCILIEIALWVEPPGYRYCLKLCDGHHTENKNDESQGYIKGFTEPVLVPLPTTIQLQTIQFNHGGIFRSGQDWALEVTAMRSMDGYTPEQVGFANCLKDESIELVASIFGPWDCFRSYEKQYHSMQIDDKEEEIVSMRMEFIWKLRPGQLRVFFLDEEMYPEACLWEDGYNEGCFGQVVIDSDDNPVCRLCEHAAWPLNKDQTSSILL